MNRIFYIIFTFSLFFNKSCCSLIKQQNELLKELFETRNYDNKVRPSQFYNDTVFVKFRMYFNQILDVSEVSQKIETKLFLLHIWEDKRLSWQPSDYGGIKTLHIPADKVWLPIFVLYNNADGDFGISQFTKVKVFGNGTLEWKPPAIFKSFCEIQECKSVTEGGAVASLERSIAKVADFPFDTQNCTMKIGPWTDHSALIDMVNSDWKVQNHVCDFPDISTYEESGEWNLLKVGCYKHYLKYECCSEIYIDLTYHFVLQRRPLYLILNILFPTMLFSFLTCAVFYLPSDAGEKMTLSISLLLSLIVFLLVIVEAIPSTANGVPLLCQYIVFTMVLVCLSIITTVGVLNIHYRGPATHIMSDRMKKIFMIWLPKLIFSSTMKRLDPYEDEKKAAMKFPPFFRDISEISGQSSETRKQLMGNDVIEAANGVAYLSDYFKDQQESQKQEDQWKYVAMVIDHFLLYIFMIVCFLGTIMIFGDRIRQYGLEADKFQNNEGECLLNC